MFVAPEIVHASPYGYPADIWSAGAVLFILLTGYAPFDVDSESRRLRQIAFDPVPFELLQQAGVSAVGQAFMRRVLHKDPQRRLSAAEALAHPWLTDRAAQRTSSQIELSVQPRLRQWKARRNLQRAVHTLRAVSRLERLARSARERARRESIEE
ncbi:hypothetical protein CDCA_CDCA17G4458 [Cyanidium caldarium]|uniref:Protein kinase domain-containing protein n=1 Tax=Cyanidium caldarium TaxID=2771 RepID=A0AAV9J255_CYACA|nr:hypothetical protein CDCA_CDCA17G4458 [Cyanidium caldarium]